MIQQVSKTSINTDFRLKQSKRAQTAPIRVNNIDRKFIQTEWFLPLIEMSYDNSFLCIETPLKTLKRLSNRGWNFGKRQKSRESFTTFSFTSTIFFEVSVKLICNHISDSAQTFTLTRVKLYLRRALDKNIRYKVLEMDPKGNLYLHKTAFLCKNDIIKRLVSGKYHLVESSPIGKSLTVSHIGNQQLALQLWYVLWWVVCCNAFRLLLN